MGDIKSGRVPWIGNVTMGTSNTEYSCDLPSGLRNLEINGDLNTLTYMYFEAGATLADRFRMLDVYHYSFNIDLPSSTTVYFLCPSTTGTMSLFGWRG